LILTGTDRTPAGDTARNLVRRQLPRLHPRHARVDVRQRRGHARAQRLGLSHETGHNYYYSKSAIVAA
jgi:hypothetical protein